MGTIVRTVICAVPSTENALGLWRVTSIQIEAKVFARLSPFGIQMYSMPIGHRTSRISLCRCDRTALHARFGCRESKPFRQQSDETRRARFRRAVWCSS